MRVKVLLACFLAVICIITPARKLRAQEKIKESALRQIQTLINEKASRTPAQQKLDSRFVYMLRKQRNDEALRSVNLPLNEIKKNANGRFDVDITADVTPDLIRAIQATGTEITFQSAKFHSITASLGMDDLERIAGRADVKFIEPHGEPQHADDHFVGEPIAAVNYEPVLNSNGFTPFLNKNEKKDFHPDFKGRAENVRRQLTKAIADMKKNGFKKPFVGSRQSEGDVTHRAVDARNAFAVDGTGLKIGVLSDECSPAALAASQASGDLGTVTILPGRAGSGSDEGTAMLEIIHDLAPGAELYFATAGPSQASFAQNILDLRTAGCDIIVDDVFYYAESVFQDDNVARSVNTVTASGALYFSSAGNQGNKNDGTASVWEGDFNNAGTATVGTVALTGGTVHSFGATNYVTTLASNTSAVIYLFWANPNGGSTDDYDLYILNPGLTAVVGSSTNLQTGTQNPIEALGGNLPAGYQIVIFKKTGAASVGLHLNLFGTPISVTTSGQTHGHSSAANAFSVAATPAHNIFTTGYPVGPYPGVFTAANTLELFSSDGPRRMFFNPDGSPITPGNLTFGGNGGTVRQKPDITAADGVQVTGNGGFPVPFYGTSAAAPHAGAIAALVMHAKPGITPAQVRTALVSTAIDIETPGVDRDAGAGIVMAYQAVASTSPTPVANIFLGTSTFTEGTVNNGNGIVDPGEVGKLVVQLNNGGTANATAVTAVLSTATPGVTITQPNASYGTIAGTSSGSNTATPFIFGIDRSFACGTNITFTLTVNYTGGPGTPKVFTINYAPGLHTITITSANIAGAAATGTSEFTSASGNQVGRLNRDGVAASCASPKTASLFTSTGNRAYHAYTFTNTMSVSQCIKVNTSVPNTNLYTVAYNNSGFVPANPATNYLADFGSSSSAGSPFSFNVGPGQQFTVVMHEVNTGGGTGTGYTLTVDIATCGAAPACTTVALPSTSLPNGTEGLSYSQTLSPATGGSGVYTYSVTAGTLPAGITLNGNTLSGTPTAAGTYNFSITAADVTGCTGGTQNYTLVIDATPCSITCPANITQSNDANQCGAIVNYPAPTTSGGCGTITATPASGSFFPIGTTTVNVSSSTGGACSFTVTVNDTQAPTVTCPANITKSNDANQCGAVVTFPTITANDNCPGVTVTATPASGSLFPVGTTTVAVLATDAHGNTANCSFTVTVNDTQAPVITCPANINTTSTTGTCGKVVTFAPTATDNCGGTVTITTSPASGSTFPVGTTTVTVTAKDAANNTSNCSFTVKVTDSQLPVISAQPVAAISCVDGTASFSVTASNAVSYQWQVDNGGGFAPISGANSATLNLSNLTAAMNGYQYRVVVNGLCTPVTSNAATLTVRPAPQVGPITASPYSTLKPGQITSLSTPFTGMPGSFTWYLNNNQVSTGIAPTISGLTVDDLGTYKVVFTDISNCQAQATFVLRAEPNFEFFVYPNPNNGQFQVRFYSYNLGIQRTVNVYDSKGARVFQKAFTMNSQYEKMDVDISRHAAGLYTVELRDTDGKRLGAAQIVVTH